MLRWSEIWKGTLVPRSREMCNLFGECSLDTCFKGCHVRHKLLLLSWSFRKCFFDQGTCQAIVSFCSCRFLKYGLSFKRLCLFTLPPTPSGARQWEADLWELTSPLLWRVTAQLHTVGKFPEIELHYLRTGKDDGKAHLAIRKLMKGLDAFPLSKELKFSK